MCSTEFLSLLNFGKRLAIDAQRCRWARFKSLNAYFDAASVTVTVVIVLQPIQGGVNFLDELALSVTRSQL